MTGVEIAAEAVELADGEVQPDLWGRVDWPGRRPVELVVLPEPDVLARRLAEVAR